MVRSPQQLGPLIKIERVHRGLSQQELSDLTGIGQKNISHVENGKEGTKLETVFRLLAALDLELQLAPRSKGWPKPVGDIF